MACRRLLFLRFECIVVNSPRATLDDSLQDGGHLQEKSGGRKAKSDFCKI
jgi:hypothetical protein